MVKHNLLNANLRGLFRLIELENAKFFLLGIV